MTSAEARVSICIPAYNLARFLPTAIVSARQQTSSPWEIVVSNNHSTDGTESVLQRSASDVRIVKPPSHVGYAANCRYLVSQATGTHVVLLAADDALAPTFIREVSSHLAAAGMVTTGRFDCNDEMQVAGYQGGSYIGRKSLEAPAGFRHYLRACDYSISGTVFRRDAVLSLPPLPEDAADAFDWYLSLMIGRTQTIHRLWRPLHYYRVHESNTSRSRAKVLANATRMFDFLLDEVSWSNDERVRVEERARSFARYVADPPLGPLEHRLRMRPAGHRQGPAGVAGQPPWSLEQPWTDVLCSFCERWLSPEDLQASMEDRRRSRGAGGSSARGVVKGFARELIARGMCRAVAHPSYLVK